VRAVVNRCIFYIIRSVKSARVGLRKSLSLKFRKRGTVIDFIETCNYQ
jgi:hypothetical protein